MITNNKADNCCVTISRMDTSDLIEIKIETPTTNRVVVRMTPQDFAKALTGQAASPGRLVSWTYTY